jgi:anaphase-promoting complex subunit 2
VKIVFRLISIQIPEFRTKRDSDILSTLVGMYDSRDVVVTELQMWLARRLLQVKEYEFQEDVSLAVVIRSWI